MYFHLTNLCEFYLSIGMVQVFRQVIALDILFFNDWSPSDRPKFFVFVSSEEFHQNYPRCFLVFSNKTFRVDFINQNEFILVVNITVNSRQILQLVILFVGLQSNKQTFNIFVHFLQVHFEHFFALISFFFSFSFESDRSSFRRSLIPPNSIKNLLLFVYHENTSV